MKLNVVICMLLMVGTITNAKAFHSLLVDKASPKLPNIAEAVDVTRVTRTQNKKRDRRAFEDDENRWEYSVDPEEDDYYGEQESFHADGNGLITGADGFDANPGAGKDSLSTTEYGFVAEGDNRNTGPDFNMEVDDFDTGGGGVGIHTDETAKGELDLPIGVNKSGSIIYAFLMIMMILVTLALAIPIVYWIYCVLQKRCSHSVE